MLARWRGAEQGVKGQWPHPQPSPKTAGPLGALHGCSGPSCPSATEQLGLTTTLLPAACSAPLSSGVKACCVSGQQTATHALPLTRFIQHEELHLVGGQLAVLHQFHQPTCSGYLHCTLFTLTAHVQSAGGEHSACTQEESPCNYQQQALHQLQQAASGCVRLIQARSATTSSHPPGVAVTMSTPSFMLCICLEALMPPTTNACLTTGEARCLQNTETCSCVCSASSLQRMGFHARGKFGLVIDG